MKTETSKEKLLSLLVVFFMVLSIVMLYIGIKNGKETGYVYGYHTACEDSEWKSGVCQALLRYELEQMDQPDEPDYR